MRIRWVSVALSASLAGACRPAEAPPDAGPRIPPDDARLRWVGGFPALVDTSTGPAVYGAARRRWRTATVAFSLGDLETSARAFSDLAESLRRSAVDHPQHTGAFRAARCMAYENIGAIYRSLPDPEPGKAQLRRAKVEDPDCAESITRALGRFEADDLPPNPITETRALDAAPPGPRASTADPPDDG